ncbi:DUF4251 domain-containing protein [Mucilaginibacter sp.]
MKTFIKLSITILVFSFATASAQQTAKQARQQEKAKAITDKINSLKYTFVAEYVQPLGGRQRYLTSEYDLRVTPDSVIAYLPYFGRVYMDVPYNPSDDGIKFTSTKFDYKIDPKKKGGWTIIIDLHDVKRTSQIYLQVFTNGSATLQATSNTRDAITFLGHIKDNEK